MDGKPASPSTRRLWRLASVRTAMIRLLSSSNSRARENICPSQRWDPSAVFTFEIPFGFSTLPTHPCLSALAGLASFLLIQTHPFIDVLFAARGGGGGGGPPSHHHDHRACSGFPPPEGVPRGRGPKGRPRCRTSCLMLQLTLSHSRPYTPSYE